MLKRTLIGLVAIGILASFMGIGGFSLFTATTDNDGNAFTSGSVEISTSPATAFLTLLNMAPLDTVTAQLTVSNDGSLPMRYSMTTATTDTDGLHLDQVLTLVIKEKTSNPCATFDGTTIYTGTLKAGFIGDPTPGGDDGDRTLAAETPEDLCFKVTLPDVTAPMSAATTATFTFDAEQTANNP